MPTSPGRRGRPRTGPNPERVQEILDIAAEVFLARGYDATSMKDIADAVDLRKGSLYYWVKSKDDLLYEIIKPFYAVAHDAVAPFTEADGDALERLVGFVHAHVRFVTENLRGFVIKMREFTQLSPKRRAELKRKGDTYYRMLIEILKDGVEQDLVDPQLDLRLTAVTIVGQLNSMAQWYDKGGKYSPDELANHFASLVLASVASDRAVKRLGGLQALRRHYGLLDPGGMAVPGGA